MHVLQVLVCEKLELVNEYYFALVMERSFMVHFASLMLSASRDIIYYITRIGNLGSSSTLSVTHVPVCIYVYTCVLASSLLVFCSHMQLGKS